MPTGQTLITNTLTKLNIVDQNASPSASDSVYALSELNNMFSSWSIDEGLIYAVLSASYNLTAFQQSYAIGPSGADFTAPLPARIYKAFIVQATIFTGGTTATSKTITATVTAGLYVGQGLRGAGVPDGTTILSIIANTSIGVSQPATATASATLTATGLNRNEVEIVESGKYYAHNDLGASAATPDELYPDYNVDSNGNARLYLWPVANEVQPSALELETAVNFTTWALSDNYNLPPGYQDALEWALAFRLLPGFGAIVDARTAQVVEAEGVKAEARLRVMNQKNRQLSPEAVMVPGAQQQPAARQ